MSDQITTRWQERAQRLYPDKQLVGDGPLAVVTADGRVCLFAATPMYLDRDNFDKWTNLLVSDKQNHLVNLRDVRIPEPPKVEQKPVQFPNYGGLYRIPGEGQDE